jgi:hypothetical protein
MLQELVGIIWTRKLREKFGPSSRPSGATRHVLEARPFLSGAWPAENRSPEESSQISTCETPIFIGIERRPKRESSNELLGNEISIADFAVQPHIFRHRIEHRFSNGISQRAAQARPNQHPRFPFAHYVEVALPATRTTNVKGRPMLPAAGTEFSILGQHSSAGFARSKRRCLMNRRNWRWRWAIERRELRTMWALNLFADSMLREFDIPRAFAA